MGKLTVDKWLWLWFNSTIIFSKTMTENLLPSEASESRRLVRADAEESSDLLPELVS